MTVQGIVQKGKVVLCKPSVFAEGTLVSVRALARKAAKNGAPSPRRRETAAQMLRRLGLAAQELDLPTDLSRNHDHYLYGVPKKK
jgi:hypothetical protein